MNTIVMKRIVKIIKAYWFMDTLGTNFLLPFYMILAGVMSISFCFDTTSMVLNYVNRGTTIWFSNTLTLLMYLINSSSIFISFIQVNTTRKGEVTSDINNFLIQAPVRKKDKYTTIFCIYTIESIPFLIAVIYFSGLNIFVSNSDYISAYSGFLILIYCIWTITMSISIGFSSLAAKKYHPLRFLFLLVMVVSLIFGRYLSSIPYAQQATLVTEQNMFIGLGSRFVPVLKACRHIGGWLGLIIILASSLISYCLCCKLPLKISEKEGA